MTYLLNISQCLTNQAFLIYKTQLLCLFYHNKTQTVKTQFFSANVQKLDEIVFVSVEKLMGITCQPVLCKL